MLGICDNGTLGRLTEQEIDKTFAIFSKIVNDNNSVIIHIEKKVYNDSYIIYAIVQKMESFKIKELNVVFVGPTQHGKTTTIGYIVYGQKDNGTNYGRNLIFKHEHEKVSGTTSSVKKEIIGLKNGMLVNYNVGIHSGWDDIVEMSDKIINIIDLPGNLKYFKSTFFGLSTYDIDGIVIVIDPSKLTESQNNEKLFYISYANSLNIQYTLLEIYDSSNDTLDTLNKIQFCNVTGNGLDKFVNFLDGIEKRSNDEQQNSSESLFCVLETFCVPDVGVIFSGTMKVGTMSVGHNVYLTDGNVYFRTKIRSIQRKQIDSMTLYTGENGAVQLEFNDIIPEISKHMMITTRQYPVYSSFIFEVLGKTSDMPKGHCVMFVDNIMSTVMIFTNGDKFLLKSMNNIVVPSINTNNCIAFLKFDNSVAFGKLSLPADEV